MIVKLEGAANKALRWVRRAAAKAQELRPTLEGVYVKDGVVVATDGYRLHAVQTSALNEVDGQIVTLGKLLVKSTTVAVAVVEGTTYPNYHSIIPKGEEATAEVTVDGKLLSEAVKGMGFVTLRFYEKTTRTIPLEVHGEVDGHKTYALIMPVHVSDKKELWRP